MRSKDCSCCPVKEIDCSKYQILSCVKMKDFYCKVYRKAVEDLADELQTDNSVYEEQLKHIRSVAEDLSEANELMQNYCYAKVSDDDLQLIEAVGDTLKELADQLGVSQRHVMSNLQNTSRGLGKGLFMKIEFDDTEE